VRQPESRNWVGYLLDELCVDLGFCLPKAEYARLEATPPPDVDAFTDAVFVAEGFDPQRADKDLRGEIRTRVARYFRTDVPDEIRRDIGALLDELSQLRVNISGSLYAEKSFGSYYVDFDAFGTAFRIIRDRRQYMIDANVDQLKALGLWRAFNSREELREAALTYVSAVAP
jgi:hypothetical protein